MALASMRKDVDPQGDLAGAGAEHLAAGLDEIAQVELLVEELQGGFADLVGAQEELDAPVAIFDVGEGDLAHRAHGAQASDQGGAHRHWSSGRPCFSCGCSRCFGGFKGLDRFLAGVGALGLGGVGLDARPGAGFPVFPGGFARGWSIE